MLLGYAMWQFKDSEKSTSSTNLDSYAKEYTEIDTEEPDSDVSLEETYNSYSDELVSFDYPKDWTASVELGEVNILDSSEKEANAVRSIILSDGKGSEYKLTALESPWDGGPFLYYLDVDKKMVWDSTGHKSDKIVDEKLDESYKVDSDITIGQIYEFGKPGGALYEGVAIMADPLPSLYHKDRNFNFVRKEGDYYLLYADETFINLGVYSDSGNSLKYYMLGSFQCGDTDKTSAEACINAYNVFLSSLKYKG